MLIVFGAPLYKRAIPPLFLSEEEEESPSYFWANLSPQQTVQLSFSIPKYFDPLPIEY
jgi:hypothetical protein